MKATVCHNQRNARIFLYILFLTGAIPTLAQIPKEIYLQETIEEGTFEEATLDKALRELGYDEEALQKKMKPSGQQSSSSSPVSSGAVNAFIKILFWLIAIAAIVFFALRAFSWDQIAGSKKNKDPDQPKELDIRIEHIEDNLEEVNIPKLITKYETEKDYRTVVRLLYLEIIKSLAEKRMIKWKKEKTNNDYLREVKNTPVFKPLKETTLVFEKIWYGNYPVTMDLFLSLKPKFDNLLNQINR